MPGLLVRDRNDGPVAHIKVFVKWKDGISTVYTDSSGTADLIASGYIEYVEVKGQRIPVEVRLEGNQSYRLKLET